MIHTYINQISRRIMEINNPLFVGHFTSIETALLKILPNNRLMLSKICNVNDPYENIMTWIDSMGYGHEIKYDAPAKLEQIRILVGNHIKMLSTCEFMESNSSDRDLENYYYGNSAMWAHYGNKHTGICLIFNKEKLGRIINNIPHKDKVLERGVKYTSWRSIGNPGVTIEHHFLDECCEDLDKLFNAINCNSLLENYFFSKSLCWEHEKEYRWLIFTESPSDIFIDYGDALHGVVLGSNTDISCVNYCRSLNIKNIYQVTFQDNKFALTKY